MMHTAPQQQATEDGWEVVREDVTADQTSGDETVLVHGTEPTATAIVTPTAPIVETSLEVAATPETPKAAAPMPEAPERTEAAVEPTTESVIEQGSPVFSEPVFSEPTTVEPTTESAIEQGSPDGKSTSTRWSPRRTAPTRSPAGWATGSGSPCSPLYWFSPPGFTRSPAAAARPR